MKWKPFFERLEARHGLRVDSAAHIWLLHHLFLESLNNNIQEWAGHWNAHGMHLKREQDNVPRDMFILGMRRHVEDDTIGRQEEDVQDMEDYGIDWEAADDKQLVCQLQEQAENPFDGYALDTLNEVPCKPPECPLTRDQVNALDSMLVTQFNMSIARDMDVYMSIWIQALTWCHDMF